MRIRRYVVSEWEKGNNFTVDTILKVMKEMDLLTQVMTEVSEAKAQVIQSKSMY